MNFRSIRKFLAPRWLVEGDGELVGYALDVVRDASAHRLYRGLLARFPQNDPTGTPAPPDALAAMGRDRRVIRGINETPESYARRLKAWLDDRKTAGNPFALMKKLSEYTGPLPSFRTFDVRGNCYSRAVDGTESYLWNQANWDWDGDLSGTKWSRFWVVIYPNGLWTPSTYNWGDTTGPGWGGSANGSLGSTATADEVKTIQFIVNDWKTAGSRCVNIILAFDPTSFDPAQPLHGTGMPDGLWKHWSKNVGGVQVPARLSTARYWDGA